MKALLLLNGPKGWQTGIEDGFDYLTSTTQLGAVQYFYFDHFLSNSNGRSANEKILSIASEMQPDIIIWFHIRNFPLNRTLLTLLRGLPSKPKIIYDEGDMYGGWEKPLTSSMKHIMAHADAVSIRGLGAFAKEVERYNKNVIYTPHHADIARFDSEADVQTERKHWSIFVGNRIRSRVLGGLKRIPGAREREKFVRDAGFHLEERFSLFGHGWTNFVGNRGVLPFQDQISLCRDTWIQFSYEHYPKIPYYFSNRLPISLMSGCLYVCHYHEGYENIFPLGDFIFTFRTFEEAMDINRYLASLPTANLLERSRRARAFAYEYYHPYPIWSRFLQNVQRFCSR